MKKNNQTNPTPLIVGFKRKWAEVLFLVISYVAIIFAIGLLFVGSYNQCVKDALDGSCLTEDIEPNPFPMLPKFENSAGSNMFERMK